MKLKILTGALALLLTGSVLTGFSTQAAPSKAESDDHLAQEISEAVFRMDGATAQVSYDGGSTWDTSPTVELPDFYSYEEFAGWIETESDNLQALVAAGELTQKEAAAAIAQYQSALSGIEDGVQVGKRSSYEEDQIFFSMPNNPQSEVFQTVLYDGNSYRNFGPYNTKAELYAALEQYTNDQTKSGNMTEVEANSILFADQLPDDGLRGGPFFRVDDGTAVPVAGHRAVVGTGIAQGHRQCNAALHRSGQVIPAGTGSLLIGAAVIGVNARLDAVSHRAIRIFHVVEGAAAAEAAGSRDGQICNGRRCALTIIILAKCDLVRIDVDPVLDRHAGSIGGHRQCCRHDQRQHKGCHVFECFQMASSSTKDKTPLFPERSCVLFFLSLHREHR